tara:strand:- start:9442 stop:11619 length:2178 start_codon:yes stop_codon:yes gene_type:complete
MENAEQMSLLKEAIRTDYRGSFEELWAGGQQPQEGQPQQQMEAPEPQMQKPTQMQGNPTAMPEQAELQGDLVRSYESENPDIGNLPMGEDVKGTLSAPNEYRAGGVEESDIYNRTYSKEKEVNPNMPAVDVTPRMQSYRDGVHPNMPAVNVTPKMEAQRDFDKAFEGVGSAENTPDWVKGIPGGGAITPDNNPALMLMPVAKGLQLLNTYRKSLSATAFNTAKGMVKDGVPYGVLAAMLEAAVERAFSSGDEETENKVKMRTGGVEKLDIYKRTHTGQQDPPVYDPYAELHSASDNTQVSNNAAFNASFQTPEGSNWNTATGKLQENWSGPQSGEVTPNNIIPELMFPFGKTLKLGAKAVKTLKAVKKSKTIAPEYLKDIQRFTGNSDVGLKNATYSKSLNISEDMALMDKNAANLYSEAIESSVGLVSNTVKRKAAEIATPRGQERLLSLYVEGGMPYKAAVSKAKARAKEIKNISIDNVTETSKWRNPPNYGPSQKPYEHRGRLFPGTSSYRTATGASPERVGIGLDQLTNVPTIRHEITHAMQEGMLTSLDKTLSKITPKKNLSGAAKDAYTYFTKGGSNSAYPIEASPFLAELRATLIEKGFMKYANDGYFKNISSKDLKKAYKELFSNPSHRVIDKVSPVSGKSEILVSSSQKIFDFMDPTEANFKLLLESLNKLPTAVGAAALGTKMYNKNTDSGDASEAYKYGGQAPTYNPVGPLKKR